MRVNDLIPYGSLAGKVASILNYTMTYKDKVFTKELYDNESEEFQKIALEAQKEDLVLVYVRQIEIMVSNIK